MTSVPAAKFIEPPGPVSARPALLDEASAVCRRAGASDIALCAGTVDAEVWGLPLVIVSNPRDQLACLLRVNVLDNATTLAGPDSALVAYPNDDTLYSRMWFGRRSGFWSAWDRAPAVLRLPAASESDKPFHLQQAEQIQAFRDAWQKAGHDREPRVSVSRSIFTLVDDRDRAYFGRQNQDTDQIGFIDAKTQAIFGRTYAAEPDVLIQQLKEDEAIAAADTLLLTVPSQLGVDYNAHAIDSILTHVAPALGWR